MVKCKCGKEDLMKAFYLLEKAGLNKGLTIRCDGCDEVIVRKTSRGQ